MYRTRRTAAGTAPRIRARARCSSGTRLEQARGAWSCGTGRDGGVVASAPLGPGPVVQRRLVVAQEMERVEEGAGAGARAAGGDDGTRGVDARVEQPPPERLGGQQGAVGCDQRRVRQAPAAGDVAAPKAGTRLGVG